MNLAEERFKTGLTEVMNMAIMDLDKDKTESVTNSEAINNTSEINFLKQEIKKLQAKLQNTSQFNPNNNVANNSRGGRPNFNSRFRNNDYPRQFYCWTHRAGHSG